MLEVVGLVSFDEFQYNTVGDAMESDTLASSVATFWLSRPDATDLGEKWDKSMAALLAVVGALSGDVETKMMISEKGLLIGHSLYWDRVGAVLFFGGTCPEGTDRRSS